MNPPTLPDPRLAHPEFGRVAARRDALVKERVALIERRGVLDANSPDRYNSRPHGEIAGVFDRMKAVEDELAEIDRTYGVMEREAAQAARALFAPDYAALVHGTALHVAALMEPLLALLQMNSEMRLAGVGGRVPYMDPGRAWLKAHVEFLVDAAELGLIDPPADLDRYPATRFFMSQPPATLLNA
ncbi:MAG: hypothetical protein WC273_12605 [Dehalococcoidia bacterium]